MEPVKFNGHNCVFAEKQPEYLPLPAFRADNDEGTVVSCWKLTDEEIEQLKESKTIFLTVWTFGQRLQPQLPSILNPVDLMEPKQYGGIKKEPRIDGVLIDIPEVAECPECGRNIDILNGHFTTHNPGQQGVVCTGSEKDWRPILKTE